MSARLSPEATKSILFIVLDKNPRLEEVLQLVADEKFIDLAQVLSRPNSRIDFAKLSTAKSIDEVTGVLMLLEKKELDEIYNILLQELQIFYKTTLTFFDLNNIYSAILRGDKKSIKLEFSGFQELEAYSICFESKRYSCLLNKFLESVVQALNTAVKPLGESPAKSFGCFLLLTIANYCKHMLNSNRLNIAIEQPLEEFVREAVHKYAPKEPDTWLIITRISDVVTYLQDVFKKDPSRVTLYEARYVYRVCKDILFYSTQLIDLLTLYLINRYYEIYVLKYVLPQSQVFK
jgi:hypothetical protein